MRFGIDRLGKISVNEGVVKKHWETILDKLKSQGWQVRWVEAKHGGESGWTVTATLGKQRHSTHANDISLAFQELEASFSDQKMGVRPRG